MDAPYRVEDHKITTGFNGRATVEYAIHRTGDGPLVFGTDLVLMHKIAGLLNEEENGKDSGR